MLISLSYSPSYLLSFYLFNLYSRARPLTSKYKTFCFLPGGAHVRQTAGVLRRSDQRALPTGLRAAHSGNPARGGVPEKSAAHAGVTRPVLTRLRRTCPRTLTFLQSPKKQTPFRTPWAVGDGTER